MLKVIRSENFPPKQKLGAFDMKMLQKLGTFNMTFTYLLTTYFNEKTVIEYRLSQIEHKDESNSCLQIQNQIHQINLK